jgi:polar amino acid transport system substrate-binding protein
MSKRGWTVSLLVAIATAVAGCSKQTSTSSTLTVCIDSSSPAAAMDRKLAQAVANDQSAALSVHEFDGSGDDDGFSLSQFNTLLDKQCQLVLGFPLRGRAALPGGLTATANYARTSFLLVTPADSKARSLAALSSGSKVAITFQTTPQLLLVRYPGLEVDIHRDDKESIAALEQGKDQAGALWRPAVVKYLSEDHQIERFALTELGEPEVVFGLVALYTQAHEAVAHNFEASVQHLQEQGKLAALLQPYADGPAPAVKSDKSDNQAPAAANAAPSASAAPSAAPAAPEEPAAPPDVPRPALYTAAQAEKGKAAFSENCALCHGETLEGRAGPALKGKHFAPNSGKYKVGDIFTIVSKNMPATQPGSLTHDTYVEIMAYLLQQNGYPAGDKALSFDEAKDSTVPVIYSAL